MCKRLRPWRVIRDGDHPAPKAKHRTCIPVESIKAAIGAFSKGQERAPAEWAAVTTSTLLASLADSRSTISKPTASDIEYRNRFPPEQRSASSSRRLRTLGTPRPLLTQQEFERLRNPFLPFIRQLLEQADHANRG